MNMKKVLGAVTAAALAATALVMPTSAADSYKAGLIFQTQSWMYRNTLDETTLQGGPDDATTSFVDATITGDGSYTVEIKGLPEDPGDWHSLGLLTTIPANDAVTIEITAVEGATLNSANKPTIEGDMIKANLINEWNEGGVKENPVVTLGENPTDIKVTFTISGLGGGDASGDNTTGDDNKTPDDGNNGSAGGDTNQTTPDKTNADTGVEGVAVVAGLAVIAAGAVVVAKKRK